MRALPTAAVFTTVEALEAGWTRSALKNAVLQGRLIRLRRGTYTAMPDPGRAEAAIATARLIPRAVVSHRSAVLLHGLPLLGSQPPVPEITVPPRSGGKLAAVHLHRAQLRPGDVCAIAGADVTSVARSVVDLARHRPTAVAVAAIDAALYRRVVTDEQIADVLDFCRAWPRIRAARRAVNLSDGRAESPLESASRLVLTWLRLPAAEPQKYIFDRHGKFVGRADFYWDEFGVVGEADGRGKYDDRLVLTKEKDRQEAFEDLGLVVVRWGWLHVTSARYVLRSKVERGFERGSRRDASGFPRLWTL
jgi:predicted transcriptional regulator of viral defense system